MKRAVVIAVVIAMLVGVGGLSALVALETRSDDGPTSTDLLGAPTTTPGPGATEPPEPGLESFYSQRLDWSVCRDKFLCATLTVPLDYRHPGAKTIDLALLKVPAANPDERIGSLLVNPGGPGEPGTDYASHADAVFRQPVLDTYDIVGFDPRGTGSSNPVDCVDDQQLDASLAEDPDPDTSAESSSYLQTGRDFWSGCAARSGQLSAHISTIEAARDMDVLRAALGESTMTYFGASYGTELGATYADLFPQKVGRMVLDGAVDLSIGPNALALEQARGFETALRSYVQDCVDGGDCVLGDSVDEGIARIQKFLADVDAKPLKTGQARDLTEGYAAYGITAALYSKDFWPYLTQGLTSAFDGDGTVLLALADAYASRGPNGFINNSMEAFPAISCLDDPTSVSGAQVQAITPAFERASPTFGRIFAWGQTDCRGIQVRSSEKPRDIHAAGADPIVVIGTTRDPATPMRWAEHLADQLDSGVLIRRDGDGHTGYNSGNDCVDDAVDAYLIDGTVPEDGLSC